MPAQSFLLSCVGLLALAYGASLVAPTAIGLAEDFSTSGRLMIRHCYLPTGAPDLYANAGATRFWLGPRNTSAEEILPRAVDSLCPKSPKTGDPS